MFIEESLYKEILKYMIIPTCDIICLNSQKEILLGLRKNEPLKGVFYFPGGRREKNESLLASTKRKAKEEIGIDIDVNNLIFLGIYDDIYNNSSFEGISTHCECVTFVYPISDEEIDQIKNDVQHDSLQFFSYNDGSLYPDVKQRIEDMKRQKIL